MSDMQGNPYVRSSKASTADGAVVVNALFALAYEQRTANLLKWIELVDRARPEGVYPTEADVELQAQVVKRLGLNGGDDE